MEPEAPAGWSARGVARGVGVACVALGVGAWTGYLIAHERPPAPDQAPHGAAPAGSDPHMPPQPPQQQVPSPPPRVTPAAELAFLAPLREGGALAGFVVEEIDGVDEAGLLRVVCRREAAMVELQIALRAEGPPPPAVSGRFAVFYANHGAPPKDAEALAVALAAVLDKNASVPAPSGLRTFTPGGR